MTAFTTWLDRLTGRVTMYRLVLLALLAVLAESLIMSGLGRIAYAPGAIVVSAAVAVVATVVSNRLVALIVRVKPHTESSIVTGLILAFLFTPQLTGSSLGYVALAGVIASVSKYLLAVRGRHVFNPAAVSALVMSIAFPAAFPSWWVGAPAILPIVVVGACVILFRTRHLQMGVLFFVVATVSVTATYTANGFVAPLALQSALLSSPIVFFAGFMLSEPLTLPPKRWQQLALAVVVGVLFGLSLHVGPVYNSYELALVVGNVLAFAVGQRRGLRLAFVSKEQLTPTSWEMTFRPAHPVRFGAGQFMELSLPHARADVRGQRRVFSIASGAHDPSVVRFGFRTSERPSTFKAALLALSPGDVVSATGVGGDFTLPRDPATPLLFVAGGIGITPFISQLQHLRATGDTRSVTLVYSVPSLEEAPYVAELVRLETRVLVVAPAAPSSLPDGWEYLGAGPLTAALVQAGAQDAADRRAYVSGSPGFVHSVRRTLHEAGVRRVTTDAFSGY
ncbi:RnfABCDGE type electron transport complex subunit D [Frondihabitans australicus]|uniref:Ferredoxin-NADP reductase n=1 Tax=Frondihabitans australicus TaxID=386892 RepID=A0A495IN05_9MICO|nr:RnfABCDGE type electron transport complex subunit D [Frondihabitans australicus]RKR76561.1 ferredoxin-NADP reductase [Frondihabitans australicus]